MTRNYIIIVPEYLSMNGYSIRFKHGSKQVMSPIPMVNWTSMDCVITSCAC